MSKLLLEIDESVCSFNGEYYTSYEGQNDFFDRYLRVFDAMKIVCRCEIISSLEGKNQPINNRIVIVAVPMFRGVAGYFRMQTAIGKHLTNVTEGCDCAILRIPSALSVEVYRQLRRKRIPYATEIVYDAKDGSRGSNSLLDRVAWEYQHYIMKKMSSHAIGVSCVTEFYLQKHYYSKIDNSFVSNYSSLSLPSHFYTGPRIFPVKSVLTISHIANQIIFNGRKGHNEVIDAVAILKDRGYNVVVKFAGKDYDNGVALLKQYADKKDVSDRVVFAGFLSREELEKYLEESDLYVMPTRAEGLPRVIIEAMAKGLPCLTTDVSGNSELVDKEMLFDYDNTMDLANKIERLIKNPVLYENVSKNNFERSLKYEASILEKRRDEFYNKLKNVGINNK